MRNPAYITYLCGFYGLGAAGAKGKVAPQVAARVAPVAPAPAPLQRGGAVKVAPVRRPARGPEPAAVVERQAPPLFVPKDVPQPPPGGGKAKGGGGIKLTAQPSGAVKSKIEAALKNLLKNQP